MTDFLLELLSEEIPARMQAKARADLERLFIAQMDDAGLKAEETTVYSTPRRLALIAKNLPQQTEAVSEESKGPPEGAPDQAVDGFCRKNGVSRDQLEVRDVKGRPTYFAVINRPGRDTKDVLAAAIPAIVRAFPWPKSMRWGEASLSTESLRWVRPLSGIVALFGEDLVECEIDGLTSGNETVGHRFHHQGSITIGSAADYADKLRDAHVLVDHEERQDIIREGAKEVAGIAEVFEDEGLVIENAGLTEFPVPLLGNFDPAFLDVPPEVIQLTARKNQKYFVCGQDGELWSRFVFVANIESNDPTAVVEGNEKVLAARLSDAKFFWELDQKTSLEDHAKKLGNIVFHEKLGTVADKVERVAKLAEWLVSLEGNGFDQSSPGDALHREVTEAARLCKADLVTEMVGEFPDLQGLMGGYYAEKQGKSEAVAHAIRDHYKPVGQGDEVPTDAVTVAVSLADKLDTLVGFFVIKERPTGSKDPFALRRAALGIIELVLANNLRLELDYITAKASNLILRTIETGNGSQSESWIEEHLGAELYRAVPDFFVDRLKVQQKGAGVRHDIIDAIVSSGRRDDLVLILARVNALQAFVETEDGTNLLAGYKRASNILKKEDVTPAQAGVSGDGEQTPEMPASAGMTELDYSPEPSEKALVAALNAAEPQVGGAIESEAFTDAMTALAALRGPIDRFFDDVTVNDEDPDKRKARLALLARFRDAVHQVADFSKIEG
ncbi:MAG: glycine--tRNA ligase subunit beta [Pseudomonadota bacterium]